MKKKQKEHFFSDKGACLRPTWSRRKVALAFMMYVVISGCAAAFPNAPNLETHQARECLRACQKKYKPCMDQCTGLHLKAASREACRSECIEALGDCYDRCAQQEKAQGGYPQ